MRLLTIVNVEEERYEMDGQIILVYNQILQLY
jgi:hypothetical protein